MRARGAAGAALVLLLLAGCAPAGASTDGPDVATYEPAGPGGDSAELVGTLALDGPCLTLRDDDQETWVPVFPAGRAVVAGDPATLIWDGEEYADGDTLRLAGGQALVDVPAGCDEHGGATWVVDGS